MEALLRVSCNGTPQRGSNACGRAVLPAPFGYDAVVRQSPRDDPAASRMTTPVARCHVKEDELDRKMARITR